VLIIWRDELLRLSKLFFCLTANTRGFGVLVKQAETMINERKYQEGLALLERAEQNNPVDPTIYLVRPRAFIELKQRREFQVLPSMLDRQS